MNYNTIYDDQGPIDTYESIDAVMVEDVTPAPADKIGKVNAREVYIREGAGKNYDPVGTVKQDDEVLIYGEENGFYMIETSNGKQGYVMETFVDII